MKGKFIDRVRSNITAALEANDGEPLTLEFGGEKLPDDQGSPDSQLAGDGAKLLSDIEAMVPEKIKDLVDSVPSSIMFALSILLGGSKLSLAMQSMQSNKYMRNFFFNLILLLAMRKDQDEIESNVRKLLSGSAATAAMDRLGKVYDELIANKEPDKLDIAVLQGEVAKLIKSMPPITLKDIKGENSAQTGVGA